MPAKIHLARYLCPKSELHGNQTLDLLCMNNLVMIKCNRSMLLVGVLFLFC